MIESICYTKKLPDYDYVNYVIPLDKCKQFKELVNKFSYYKNFDFVSFRPNKYNQGICVNQNKCLVKQNWEYIIEQHITKANFICNNKDRGLTKEDNITQKDIFISQILKYIKNNKLAVLASYPLFLYEYFGIEVIQKNCNNNCTLGNS